MAGYSDFAFVYDSLMCEVDYSARAEYIYSLFEKHGKAPTLLLDLACGTGGFSTQMAQKGAEVIGVDMSEEMLSVARENAAELSLDILFLCQKAEELDLYGTVDGAICCLDSLNHITDIQSLKLAINRVSLFLEQGSLFIFDVNTPYKHREVLGNNTFVIEQENVFCVWQNELRACGRVTDISLDFFVEQDGVYERFSEDFSERAYSETELRAILEEAGFTVCAVYDDMTEQPLKDTSERAIFVAKKNCQQNREDSI